VSSFGGSLKFYFCFPFFSLILGMLKLFLLFFACAVALCFLKSLTLIFSASFFPFFNFVALSFVPRSGDADPDRLRLIYLILEYVIGLLSKTT
jgi:hypothetical protein